MRRAARHVLYAFLTGFLLLWNGPALALDPALEVNQYAHTAWRYRDGFARSYITSIAQTPDGYLWLGSTAGLWRFDGVRAVPWKPPPGHSLPDNRIRALLAAKDGSLLIGTRNGLARIKDGGLTRLPQFEGATIDGLVEARDGTVWAGGQARNGLALLCSIDRNKTHCSGTDGSLGPEVYSLFEDRAGGLWIMTYNSIWRWKPGPPQPYALPIQVSKESFAQDAAGTLLVARNGLQKFRDGKFETVPLPANPTVYCVFADRDGGVWAGTLEKGLFHLHDGRIDAFASSDGLSGNTVDEIFEDREGNIWITTREGLDRFRALPATTYSAEQGLLRAANSVLAAPDGSVWIPGSDALHRWQGGKLVVYRPPPQNGLPKPGPNDVIAPGLPRRSFGSLLRDRAGRIWYGAFSGLGYFENGHFTPVPGLPEGYVDSMAEDEDGNLWIAHRSGLYRLSRDLALEPVGTPFPKTEHIYQLAADPVRGGLWIGFAEGEVVHLVNGTVVASFGPKQGFVRGFVNEVRVTPDGTVWVARDGGLSRIKDGRAATLDSKGGLPCDTVHASIEGDDGAFWVYTVCGLVRIPRADMEARIAAAERHKPLPAIHSLVLDEGDGVASFETPGSTATPHLTKAADGRLWFIAPDGVTMVDPRHLAANPLPPPVHIEQVTADQKTYDPTSGLNLPPLTRDLTIAYTGLSLVAPEKMHFRFKLEGQDRDWREVVNRRSVQYSNLAPGDYRFRVIASNNSGVWNKDGASLAFTLTPAYWQTSWFLALCVAAVAGSLLAFYQWRMGQVTAAAAREREIAARDREMAQSLHDAQMELAHSNRLATMGQLSASIVHEVNQPLGAVMINAQAAKRWLGGPQPNMEEASANLDGIVREVNRATDVVKRIRTMAKKAPEHWEDLAINEAIAEVVAMTASEATKLQVIIREYLAPDLPVIRGDRVELQQVVLNLLMNAIEALSNFKTEPREIIVQTGLNGSGQLEVSVRDFGPGIPADALERIFQPFYTSKDTGLGMGLSICRTIIEAHEGRLWAGANAPHGAVFTFTLPTVPKQANAN